MTLPLHPAPPPLILPGLADLDAWRAQSRALLLARADPAAVTWLDPADPQGQLVPASSPPTPPPAEAGPALGADSTWRVPREFFPLAQFALRHKDPSKWPLLYRLLWRITIGAQPRLLAAAADDDVHRAASFAKSVRRDVHKMKAFVRFRRVLDQAGAEHFVAFHRPEHPILPLAAPFFARRFSVMRWTIITPHASATWDGASLRFGPGAPADAAPPDQLEDFWRTYYASIFNPARVNPRAMSKEMPQKYWSTLPEAAIIDELLRTAPSRTDAMTSRSIGAGGAAPYIPPTEGAPPHLALPVLAAAAESCRGCDLHKNATHVVFGHGPADAHIVLVGEQPGDQEDLAAQPFVGPAGQVLDRALAAAGLDRAACYLTNAVKHFKWTPAPRGKRRIHAKPSAVEIRACKPWLEHEIGLLRPHVLVLLGATAAQSLLGAAFRVTKQRGQILTDTPFAPAVIATIHPSVVLRAPDPAASAEQFRLLSADLALAAAQLRSAG